MSYVEYGYDNMCDFENLYQAHLSAKSGKRFKKEVIDFDMQLYRNLSDLKMQFENGSIRMVGYNRFIVHDPKERIIHAPAYRDRVIQHCLCDNILAPVLDKRLIYDNAASRVGKGTHFAIYRLTGFLRTHYRKHGSSGYFLKYDIAKYFDNIDHMILYRQLCRTGAFDDKTLWLIRQILRSYQTEPGKGLPLGNQSSQWFALFYLDGLDRVIKEKLRLKYYTRYMDDGIIVHHSKDYLKQCLAEMKEYVGKERLLEFNKKTQIVPISQGVDYLGFRFFLTDTGKVVRRLRTSNKKRMKRKLKYFKSAYAKGYIEADSIHRSLVSYSGHLSHGHTYRLKRNILKKLVLVRNSKNMETRGRKTAESEKLNLAENNKRYSGEVMKGKK